MVIKNSLFSLKELHHNRHFVIKAIKDFVKSLNQVNLEKTQAFKSGSLAIFSQTLKYTIHIVHNRFESMVDSVFFLFKRLPQGTVGLPDRVHVLLTRLRLVVSSRVFVEENLLVDERRGDAVPLPAENRPG